MNDPICSVAACESLAQCRGWCQKHYTRWQRHGDPEHAEHIHGDDIARLMSYVEKDASTECWNWIGIIRSKGYGQFNLNRRSVLAHRASYQLFKGALEPGMDLDHLCRNRRCVNPDHLEQVSHRVNLLRGETVTARNAAVTHCPQGHAYSPENTYVPPNKNARLCRACRSARRRTAKLRG